ncbi:hypothetical protein, partial [Streptomyces spororaveus]|uniref:hypothetical protein n=1 Tax=Streptomyces spororaveus TaxID=284039 RepID=UPI003617114B
MNAPWVNGFWPWQVEREGWDRRIAPAYGRGADMGVRGVRRRASCVTSARMDGALGGAAVAVPVAGEGGVAGV